MKRTTPRTIGEIIDDMIARTGLKPEFQRHTAESVWPQTVGPNIAAYTSRVTMRGTTLHVYLTSAALKEELGYSREILRDKINEAIGEETVTNIVIH